MKLFWWYIFLMYVSVILVGFFYLIDSLKLPCEFNYSEFWLSIVLIILGALGFQLASHIYYKVKQIERAKKH